MRCLGTHSLLSCGYQRGEATVDVLIDNCGLLAAQHERWHEDVSSVRFREQWQAVGEAKHGMRLHVVTHLLNPRGAQSSKGAFAECPAPEYFKGLFVVPSHDRRSYWPSHRSAKHDNRQECGWLPEEEGQ